jgi:hypothetical protein
LARTVLSPDVLSANIDALVRAQSICPTLGALSRSMRVTANDGQLRVELGNVHGNWQPLGTLFAGGIGRESPLESEACRSAGQAIVVGPALADWLDDNGRVGHLTKILLVEPDPGLATLFLSRRDWRPWFANGRLRLLTGPDFKGATTIARFLDGLRDIPIVADTERVAWQPEVMAAAMAVAARVAQNAVSNGNARRTFAGPYLLQTLANVSALAREGDTCTLEGAFAGTPAVVVGAGPSLDENVATLAALQDRAVIVAADTALRPLVSRGVRPHVVVAVDSSALNARHLAAARADEVWLVAEGSVHPSGLQPFIGRTFTFRISDHDPWPWLAAAGVTRGELRAWGSVLTSAFDLARRMGCNPIVFAGADLAYTGMRPYCRGTIYDAAWQTYLDAGCTWEQLMDDYFKRHPELSYPDIHGRPTRTAPHLVSFRDWLIEQMSAPTQTRFVNATGAGILQGACIAQIDLAAALAAAPTHADIRERLADCYRKSRAGRRDPAIVDALIARARTTRQSLPLERWVSFTAATVTEEAIVEALLTSPTVDSSDGEPAIRH